MRSAKARGLDAHESAPASHYDSGRHPRAGVVSEAAVAVINKERAALDGEAGVVGLRRDHAGLDRKASAPKGVRLGVRFGVGDVRRGGDGRPRLRRWTEPHVSLQGALKRRSRVWSRGRRGIVLVGPQRRCFAFADRGDDCRRVEWIASWTPHGSPRLYFFKQENRIAAAGLS
jgi:hypothetical protein